MISTEYIKQIINEVDKENNIYTTSRDTTTKNEMFKSLFNESLELQKKHKESGINYFNIVIEPDVVKVYKNGLFDYYEDSNSITISKKKGFRIKNLKGLKDNDEVEFFYDA